MISCGTSSSSTSTLEGASHCAVTLRAASLAEAGIAVVRRAARAEPGRGRLGREALVAASARRRRRRRGGEPCAQLALDERPVAAAIFVQLLHQRQRARPKPPRHLVEIRLRYLPHRAIELEILQRSKHQRLLARRAPPWRARRAPRRPSPSCRRRGATASDRSPPRPDQPRDHQADEHQVFRRGLPGHDDRSRSPPSARRARRNAPDERLDVGSATSVASGLSRTSVASASAGLG